MRKNLLKEVAEVFDSAEEMTGSMHPDDADDERERLGTLRREVLGLLENLVRANNHPKTRRGKPVQRTITPA